MILGNSGDMRQKVPPKHENVSAKPFRCHYEHSITRQRDHFEGRLEAKQGKVRAP